MQTSGEGHVTSLNWMQDLALTLTLTLTLTLALAVALAVALTLPLTLTSHLDAGGRLPRGRHLGPQG